ncbi:MAG: BTAD domain-containing putative transcriptional regulator [Pseudonocardiaceae bacterium]
MDFRVLGPVEIIEDGRNVVPTAPKPRQVISLLLLRRNAVVQATELIDELWEGGPPASAMTTLQTYIYKLRKILMKYGAEEILRTLPGGYMLTVPDSSIDLQRFEWDAQAGQALLEGGDPADAAEVLGRALSMWRGPTLVDVVQGELLSSYVTRLEELRFRTLELRIEADLQLGRHRELIGELKSLTRTHSLHEHLHASLMIALYRSGRRHEALEVYRVLRGNMIEDLGLEPGPELKQLHQTLLSDSPPGLPFDQDPADTMREVVASTENGKDPLCAAESIKLVARESRALVPIERPGPAPVSSAGLVPLPAQLPPDLADFTGRAALLDEIVAGFIAEDDAGADRTATRMALVSGMPMVGKTAFAVRLAHRLRTRFPDGQLYTELNGSISAGRDVSESLHGFLRALGVPDTLIPASLEERSKLFRSATAGLRLLLVVDDATSQADVSPLLLGDPKSAVIITSRRRLPELASDWSIELDVLEHPEGVELLSRIIGRARLAREPRAADELIELAGRLPLALRCIGARLATRPGLTLTELAEQLARSEQPLDLLRIGELEVRSRFDYSYQGLPRLEQGAFRLLSMLRESTFTVRVAAELLGWEHAAVESALERLADDRLVTVHCCAGEIHYAFPKLTLSYAREQLNTSLTYDGPCDNPSQTGARARTDRLTGFAEMSGRS